MSAYKKICDNCKQEIRMSNESGSWKPYNLDNSIHNCKNGTKETPTQTQKQTELSKQNEQQYQKQNGGTTTTKRKGLKIKILKSFDSEDLERQYNGFPYHIAFSTYHPVNADNRIQERLCVYYEEDSK